jgi:hypothetical protein
MNFLNTTGLTTLWSRILLLVSTELAKLSTVYAAITHTHEISGVVGLQDALNAKAPLASPALTGTPTAPTAAQSGGDSTQIATVGYVNTKSANNMQSVDNLYLKKSQMATVNGASLIGGGDIQIIAYTGTTITVDANVSSTSTNPIQSSGVYRAIEGGFWQT